MAGYQGQPEFCRALSGAGIGEEMQILIFFLLAAVFWAPFVYAFHKDRSRYRNCYLLFLGLMGSIPFVLNLFGNNMGVAFQMISLAVLIALLIVPFFLIHNGIVMLRREGRQLSHMLSLALGLVILVGEAVTIALMVKYSVTFDLDASFYRSWWFVLGSLISITVIYGSMAFLIFMIYTLFLQIIPRKRDFDYVIIHGAGLLRGDQLSKLLRDRVDKAIEVYRKDPTPPKLIPSGGQGGDETVSEAAAMKQYLLEQGIPESDILLEDGSKTTLENLKFSKDILDRQTGRKYTALVTSNYHVYRALRYCHRIGLQCTGIGSRVAFYYWPSALIREFIAIHSEKKHAVTFILGWLLCVALLLMLIFS